MTPNFDKQIKEILDIYCEAKGHASQEFKDMVKLARELGCVVEERGNKCAIKPPIDHLKKLNLPPTYYQYITHNGPEGYHPLRRYLKNCGYNHPSLKG